MKQKLFEISIELYYLSNLQMKSYQIFRVNFEVNKH